jgi:hypothetical protein
MGMYTELVLKAKLLDGTPPEVVAVFEHLFNGGDLPAVLPDHEFFKCGRWSCIGSCKSFGHIPFSISRMSTEGASGTCYIFSRSDLKNYDGEIDKFLGWAKPYLRPATGNVLGWKWCEEADRPTLLECDTNR